jgi:hypothetical protein
MQAYEQLTSGYETDRIDLLEKGAAHLNQHVEEWLTWGKAVDEFG